MRMTVADFRRDFSKSDALRRELFLFTHLLMIQIAQTAACNRFHVVEKRMARWLLMTRDRVHSNEFRITQEFLSLMLGVRRERNYLQRAASTHASSLATDVALSPSSTRSGSAAACGRYKTVKDSYTQAHA